MSSKDWDESFIQRFNGSSRAESAVGIYLLLQGNTVRINPKTLRKDWKDRFKHNDKGDLIVNNHRVEVKGLSLEFEMNQWPFRNALICSKFSFDRAEPRPDYYFLVNKSLTVAAIVDVKKTMNQWGVINQRDPARGETYEAYVMNPELLQWRELK